jgi:hypothetical protein
MKVLENPIILLRSGNGKTTTKGIEFKLCYKKIQYKKHG